MSLQESPAPPPAKNLALETTRFTRMLIQDNGLDRNDFESWVFCPGMLFGSPDKWWGDRGKRDFPHEGIDFCLYRNRNMQVLPIEAQTRIPVMHTGVVRALFTDFLGQAVIIEHETSERETGTFLSVYAHTNPLDGIQTGKIVKQGDIIATIAETHRSKAKILPHLHVTIGIPAPDFTYEPFEWNSMRNPALVTLLNPKGLIDWPCQVLDAATLDCLDR